MSGEKNKFSMEELGMRIKGQITGMTQNKKNATKTNYDVLIGKKILLVISPLKDAIVGDFVEWPVDVFTFVKNGQSVLMGNRI